jgi:hypothetical protein
MQQQPCGMTVDVRNDHEFLGSSFLGERVDTEDRQTYYQATKPAYVVIKAGGRVKLRFLAKADQAMSRIIWPSVAMHADSSLGIGSAESHSNIRLLNNGADHPASVVRPVVDVHLVPAL